MKSDGIDNLQTEPLDEDAVESLVASIADEFTERLERGERPDVNEYASRYPALAGVLREVLPAIQLMELPASGVLSGGGEPSLPGADDRVTGCLGDFRILREIGRGGMGVVYEAEQVSLGRRVALKVLPFAAALDSKHLERFKREAQAAAHLHHTNIVPVYSVGCERGVYYYAMQYIEGQSLADVITQLQQQEAKPDLVFSEMAADSAARTMLDSLTGVHEQISPLPSPQSAVRAAASAKTTTGNGRQDSAASRAAHQRTGTVTAATTERSVIGTEYFQSVALLGVQAAEALDHAHSLGIVHRDVKPANLLLEANAHLFVTDFGLAQYQSEGNLTLTGDVVGTLRYMSPEQALLNNATVDHRTDIYSLGATLYELITLHPLWDCSDRRELLQRIAFDDPVAPRRLNKRIPADLETIIQKALSKEPRDRYASAADLANDLRRFLEHKTILAKKPTLTERAAKWSRRHRSVVASGVILLIMAVAGLTVSNILIAGARSTTADAYDLLASQQKELEQKQLQTEAAFEAEALQRARAEQNFHQARQMLDFFVQVSEDELAGKREVRDVRRKLLEASLGYYQEFLQQCGDDPAARAQLAASLFRLASVLNEIGAKPDALAAFEQAREVQEALAREHPEDTEFQRGLFSIYRHMGVLRGSDQLSLLGQASVHTHLNLTPRQVEDLDALNERRSMEFREFQFWKKSREEVKEFFDRRAEETQVELQSILKPRQLKRFEQISLQLRGTQALSSSEVAVAIGLTESQVDTIDQIKKDAYDSLRNSWKMGHGSRQSREKSQNLYQESRRSTNDKLLSVLTTGQMAAWRELLGEPFNGELRFAEHGPWSCFGKPPSSGDPRRRRGSDDDDSDNLAANRIEAQGPAPESQDKETAPR